eukprot:gb/GFBE01038002.1/.p1 GENE.gb/GFBE01038002.1/~~gb/GFBE01038002.1/.p1  ORF type:complete len:392 (+),score=88.61 gb/GFBE01038002.1/:1-1176(+)
MATPQASRLRSRSGFGGSAVLLLSAAAVLTVQQRWVFVPGPAARAPAGHDSTKALTTAGASAAAAVLASPFAARAEDAGGASGDWFDPFVNFTASVIDGIDGAVGSAGLAIILYTLLVKLVTFPLQQPALRTSALLQLISPQVDEIKKKNKNDEDASNRTLRKLYAKVGLNPFSAFFPILIQLPVFVALFRAIGKLASQDAHFKDPFLWIPSLAGPVASGKPSLDWLLKTQSADHFEPLVGWHDAGLYIILPVMVILSQLLTQRLTTNSQDSAATSALFPIFIGISTLVSPAGLGLYWFTNNLLSAGQMKLAQDQVAEEFPDYKRIKDIADAKGPQDGARYTRDSPFLEDPEAVKKSVEELEEGEGQVYAKPPNTRRARRARASSKPKGKK